LVVAPVAVVRLGGLANLIDALQIVWGPWVHEKSTVLFLLWVVVDISHGFFYFCNPVRFACINIACEGNAAPEIMTRSSLC
jgi:hypothetical protein